MAGPGLRDAGMIRVICVAVAFVIATGWSLIVILAAPAPRFEPVRLAEDPANTPLGAQTVLMSAGSTTGRLAFAASVWKPAGCENIWKPETTLVSDAPACAVGATLTLTRTRVGPNTQTRPTRMSLDPNPTVVRPSANFVLTPVTSIMARAPAGSAPGENVILGATAAA